MSHSSSRKTITQDEYYQLIGLRSVADKYNEMLEALGNAAKNITQELGHDGKPDTYGHTVDYLYGSRTVDELLALVGLTIEKKKEKK